MLLLLKPNQYSCFMRYARITKNGWNNLIEHPYVLENKDDAPLAIWGQMSPTVELDPASNMPRCIGANVGNLYALQVDIDNGCTIDDFVKCYHRYSFQLYTSYSYGVFKPGHRFRAIFPLKEPLNTQHLVPPVKEVLIKLFDMCDISCFDRAHWQILPCVSSKEAPYRFFQHDGERLSFAYENFEKMAADYNDSAHWRHEIAKADYSTRPHSGAIKYAQQKLDEAQVGDRNRTMWSVLTWLKNKVQIDENEAYELIPPSAMETEWTRMIERIFK